MLSWCGPCRPGVDCLLFAAALKAHLTRTRRYPSRVCTSRAYTALGDHSLGLLIQKKEWSDEDEPSHIKADGGWQE